MTNIHQRFTDILLPIQKITTQFDAVIFDRNGLVLASHGVKQFPEEALAALAIMAMHYSRKCYSKVREEKLEVLMMIGGSGFILMADILGGTNVLAITVPDKSQIGKLLQYIVRVRREIEAMLLEENMKFEGLIHPEDLKKR